MRKAIEVVDVSTPATVFRYTGNWQGTMEGWLVEPGAGFKSLPNTLSGLKPFLMAGQWVIPGGGLPSGPMTAKSAVKAVCMAAKFKLKGVPPGTGFHSFRHAYNALVAKVGFDAAQVKQVQMDLLRHTSQRTNDRYGKSAQPVREQARRMHTDVAELAMGGIS